MGDPVLVTTLSLNGTVKSPANKNGDIVVQMGFLSSTVNYKDLELLDARKDTAQEKPKDHYSINKAATISPEINLLGCTVDEGISRLEKYLDDAVSAFNLNLTEEDIAYIDEPYIPHKIVGAL